MNTFEEGDIEVLMVDDERDILELSKMFLEKDNEIEVDITKDPNEVVSRTFDEDYNAIISDYEMPQLTGIDLLQQVREINPDFPFILHTGKGNEEIAEECISHGVSDYFQKEAGTEHYGMIARSVKQEVKNYRDKEQKRVFQQVVENSDNPVIITDTESTILYVNPAFEEVTGYKVEEVIGENPKLLSSGRHTDDEYEDMYESLEDGQIYRIKNMTNVTKSGEEYVHHQQLFPIATGGKIKYYGSISKVLRTDNENPQA